MKKLVCVLGLLVLVAAASLPVFADPHVVPDTDNAATVISKTENVAN